jgi:simple sugar transport system substrate-binding protein
MNEVIPEATRKKAQEALDAIKGRTLDPFTGPIVDNAGKERLPKGEQASQEWKDKVDFYVRGVEGKIPAGK